MTLREGGIYILPNGKKLVVAEAGKSPGVLFRLRGWYHFESTEFEINETGRLLAQGKLTAWDIQHLQDTGETI
ncbi:MAG TPA: hypothetical protein VJV03_14685 [Pyrinomonadaceae bacterium]|jgi:hypothetical protein|nr:hypothetical protein [Pyrinomonadaceae bacterium]